MKRAGASVIAFGAVSGLGRGEAALGVGAAGDAPAAVVGRDPLLSAAGLLRPFCARAARSLEVEGHGEEHGENHATTLLTYALADCAAELDAIRPGWRSARVGLAVGTSAGEMSAFEGRVRAGTLASAPATGTYLAPVIAASRPCDLSPVSLVLAACASSTVAIGLGRAWLLAGRCDLVLCGGFDAVSLFVAAGFESLRATCTEQGPLPFRQGRDGLALGEGAAVLALVREGEEDGARPVGRVVGFSATCDALHLTAPDREGRGLSRAAQAALDDAGHPSIGLVSAHGTATEYNDAAEALAIEAVLGARASATPVHALKGAVGHTLGAAGALEALAALHSMRAGVVPGSAGRGPVMPGVRLLERAEAEGVGAALKLSAAFGGANAALVLGGASDPPGRASPAPLPDVYVSRAVSVVAPPEEDLAPARLAALTGYGEDRIARADRLVQLALAACGQLRAAAGVAPSEDVGILVGHGLATEETNVRFFERIVTVGAHRAEPRRFPYTTPNAAAGECAVAFGLGGPAFAVGGGPQGGLDALAVAADLVQAGVARAMVVVAVEEVGASRSAAGGDRQPGAVAALVSREPTGARLAAWSSTLPATRADQRDGRHGRDLGTDHGGEAYRALLPLCEGQPPELRATSPWGGISHVRLVWH